MKKTTMKKSAALIMAIAMIISVFAAFGCVNASADTTFVHFYKGDYQYHYAPWSMSSYIYVQTDASSSNQKVYVHYKYNNTLGWKDSEAEFIEMLPDGSKLWKASITSEFFCTDFAVKYVANGNEYWDNNNGSNYKVKTNRVGTAPIAVQRFTRSEGISSVTAYLNNYGYQKNVFVRYTNDNWATYTDAPMSYVETLADGSEKWNAPVEYIYSGNKKDFHFCICYQVNGQTYWDNNFGSNFDFDYREYQ